MAKVVIVDDDEDIVNIVKIALTASGYEVTGITKTRGIVERLIAEQPDLILLDLMIPEIDGWQVLEMLKSYPETSELPLIVFTAASYSLPDIKEYYGPSISDYLTKPFEVAELLQKVQNAIGEPKSTT